MSESKRDEDAEFMLIIHAVISSDRRTKYVKLIERLFYMVLSREPGLRDRMIALRDKP